MKVKKPDIIENIKERLKEKEISKSSFAKMIGIQRQNVNKLVFDRNSLDTDMLIRISEALDHNFFQYFKSEDDRNKMDYDIPVKTRLIIEIGDEIQEKEMSYMFKNVK